MTAAATGRDPVAPPPGRATSCVPDAGDEQRPTRFEWERALRSAAEVTGTRLLVLLALGTYMDHAGAGARPGDARLAEELGVTDRTIRAHLRWAREAGWLERVSKGHGAGQGVARASVWAAALPSSYRNGPSASSTDHRNAASGSGGGLPEPGRGLPEPGRGTTGTQLPPTTQDRHMTTAAARIELTADDLAAIERDADCELATARDVTHRAAYRRSIVDRLARERLAQRQTEARARQAERDTTARLAELATLEPADPHAGLTAARSALEAVR